MNSIACQFDEIVKQLRSNQTATIKSNQNQNCIYHTSPTLGKFEPEFEPNQVLHVVKNLGSQEFKDHPNLN